MITHNARIGRDRDDLSHIQSYAKDGYAILDLNGRQVPSYQEWSLADARTLARLLTLAVADAELAL